MGRPQDVEETMRKNNWWADGKPALYSKDEDFLRTITDAPFLVEVDRFDETTKSWKLDTAKAHWTHALPRIMHCLWYGDQIRVRRVQEATLTCTR